MKKRKSAKPFAEIEYDELDQDDGVVLDDFCAVSSTECTGLMPNLPQDQEEEEAYTKIYTIPVPTLRKQRNTENKSER